MENYSDHLHTEGKHFFLDYSSNSWIFNPRFGIRSCIDRLLWQKCTHESRVMKRVILGLEDSWSTDWIVLYCIWKLEIPLISTYFLQANYEKNDSKLENLWTISHRCCSLTIQQVGEVEASGNFWQDFFFRKLSQVAGKGTEISIPLIFWCLSLKRKQEKKIFRWPKGSIEFIHH
jgi:hypothetical protein